MKIGLATQLSDHIESQDELPRYGESSPMTTLIRSSVPPVNSATFDSAAVRQDGVPLPSSLPIHTDRLAKGSLSFMVKRAIDLTGALVGLIFLSPVIGLIALLIRLDSRGPVLFRQLRRGYRGEEFWILKFRTMSVGAEQKLVELENSNESDGGVLFKLRNDPHHAIGRVPASLQPGRASPVVECPQGRDELGGTASPSDSRQRTALGPGS